MIIKTLRTLDCRRVDRQRRVIKTPPKENQPPAQTVILLFIHSFRVLRLWFDENRHETRENLVLLMMRFSLIERLITAEIIFIILAIDASLSHNVVFRISWNFVDFPTVPICWDFVSFIEFVFLLNWMLYYRARAHSAWAKHPKAIGRVSRSMS
jgi:hypothetical protein